MKKYRITLNEKQLGVVQYALEEYFRLRLGQDFEFSNDLAEMGQDLSADNPEHKRIFAEYIVRRDAIEEIMKAVFHIAFGVYGVPERKTDNMLIAEDIWDAIRVKRGISRWGRVLNVSGEPVPEIEVVEDEHTD